jgi:uncharacterized membrane protein SpoIIM required for sporulation/uncharacterized RDD family membrane protein YckC
MTDDRFTLVTPDRGLLEFELAGLGSRFAAHLLDLLLIGLGLAALIALAALAGVGSSVALGQISRSGAGWALSWSGALLVLGAFVLFWGYHVFFECLMRGSTPGKRQLGLRVIREDGSPIGFREAALRNLVRAADALPPPSYLLGGLTVFLDRYGRRLGDLAAGTIVVREPLGISLSGAGGGAWAARVGRGDSRHALTLPGGTVSPAQIDLAEQFLERRSTLDPERRQTLSWQIAAPLLGCVGEDRAAWEGRSDRTAECERFLEDLVKQATAPSVCGPGSVPPTTANAPATGPLSEDRLMVARLMGEGRRKNRLGSWAHHGADRRRDSPMNLHPPGAPASLPAGVLPDTTPVPAGMPALPGSWLANSSERNRWLSRSDDKERLWTEFAAELQRLGSEGRRGLEGIDGETLSRLIDQSQTLAADLARARSLDAPRTVVDRLNRLAVAAHFVLHSHASSAAGGSGSRSSRARAGFGAIARAVRASAGALAMSAAVLFGASVLAFFAVQRHPDLGYDLVPEAYLEFDPARSDNLQQIPSLVRPLASSTIIANNLQVSLLAFGLGLTAGLGTTWVLVGNGLHVGAVAGWMTAHGKGRALWGWILPHGGTELLALCLAGAAGYVLASALILPGLQRRAVALKAVAGRALTIEAGCVVLLLVAGAIEGFVSPSGIGFPVRIAVLVSSLAIWAGYFVAAGRQRSKGRCTPVGR